MAISKFKATCLGALERIRKTGLPLRVTRFGEPIADIHPPAPPFRPDDWMGSMKGTARIVEDIIEPAVDEPEWEVLR